MILYSLFTGVALESNGSGTIRMVHSDRKVSIAENTSDTRDVIVGKARSAIEEIYDMDRYRFTLTARWIPGSLQRIDPGQIRSVVPEGSVERFTNFKVSYMEKSNLKSAQVQLMVDTERKLPVANRRIANGEIIREDDMDLRWVSVPYDRGQLVEKVADVSGKTIRRTLSDGEPVRYADISSEYLVEAGDTIQLLFEQNGLRVVIESEARQSGAKDEIITIYSKETRKRYMGKVDGPGIAIWTGTL